MGCTRANVSHMHAHVHTHAHTTPPRIHLLGVSVHRILVVLVYSARCVCVCFVWVCVCGCAHVHQMFVCACTCAPCTQQQQLWAGAHSLSHYFIMRWTPDLCLCAPMIGILYYMCNITTQPHPSFYINGLISVMLRDGYICLFYIVANQLQNYW